MGRFSSDRCVQEYSDEIWNTSVRGRIRAESTLTSIAGAAGAAVGVMGFGARTAFTGHETAEIGAVSLPRLCRPSA